MKKTDFSADLKCSYLCWHCCDAHSGRSEHQPQVQSAVQQPSAGGGEDERCAAGAERGGAETPTARQPNHGGNHRGPPRRARADGQPQLSVLSAAVSLEVQQNSPGGV